MTKEETLRAAQVMIDSLKEGAVVEYRERDSTAWIKIENRDPVWDFGECDYRIAEPNHTKIADLPPVCWVRRVGMKSTTILKAVDEEQDMIMFGADWWTLPSLQNTHEYSADRINWTPFI